MVAMLNFEGASHVAKAQGMKGIETVADLPDNSGIDSIRTDQDLKWLLSMDPHIHVYMLLIGCTECSMDKCLEERRLVQRLPPSGKWDRAIGRAIGK